MKLKKYDMFILVKNVSLTFPNPSNPKNTWFQVLTKYDHTTEDYTLSNEIKASDLDVYCKYLIKSFNPLIFNCNEKAKEIIDLIKAYTLVDDIEYEISCKKDGLVPFRIKSYYFILDENEANMELISSLIK